MDDSVAIAWQKHFFLRNSSSRVAVAQQGPLFLRNTTSLVAVAAWLGPHLFFKQARPSSTMSHYTILDHFLNNTALESRGVRRVPAAVEFFRRIQSAGF